MSGDGVPDRAPDAEPRWLRFHRWWVASHWWVLAALVAVSVVLGAVGFRTQAPPGERGLTEVMYRSIQLFALEGGNVDDGAPAPWTLDVARFLAPAVSAYAVVALVLRIASAELVGLATRLRRRHVVVCGLGLGAALVRQLAAERRSVVVVEPDGAHPAIEELRVRHVPVLVGDPRDAAVLRRAGVPRARQVYVVTTHDSLNIKVAEQIRALVRADRRAAEPLRVLVHLADAQLAGMLSAAEIARATAPGTAGVRVDFFNVHASGARALLGHFPQALVGSDGRAPHVGIVGLGRLGSQIVVQAGRNWLADEHAEGERLTVTVADVGAGEKLDWLLRRHPFLGRTCTFRSVALPADPAGLVDRAMFEQPGSPPIGCVFVCWPDDAQGIGVSVALHGSLGGGVPVTVRIYDPDLAALVPRDAALDGSLRVFDQLERTCRPDEILAGALEQLARSFHDTYLRDRAASGDTPASNPSMVGWDLLPDRLRDANRAQAEHVAVKLAAIGCSMVPLTEGPVEPFELMPDEVELLAEMEHERWCESASADDPDTVAWSELSDDRREIDRLFVRRLPALLATVGLRIERAS